MVSAMIISALAIGGAASANAAGSNDTYLLKVPEEPEYTVTAEEREHFEELILAGYKAEDPFSRVWGHADFGSPAGSDISDMYSADPLSAQTSIKLDLVHDRTDGGYKLWSGRFTVGDVSTFSNKFFEPDEFDCSVSTNLSIMTSTPNYMYNFKEVTVRFTYLEGEKRVVKSAYGESNQMVADADMGGKYKGSGKLVEAQYFFYLHNGSGETSSLFEVASVHVVNEEYAESELYSELPYARMIGSYTYVDTDNLGILPTVSAE